MIMVMKQSAIHGKKNCGMELLVFDSQDFYNFRMKGGCNKSL